MKVLGTAVIDGQVYSSGKEKLKTTICYQRNGLMFEDLISLAAHFNIKLSSLKRLLDKGYSLDTIWDYLIGDMPVEECDKITAKVGFRFHIKLEIEEAENGKPAVNRTFLSKSALAEFLGINLTSLIKRFKSNKSLEEIVSTSVKECKSFSFSYRGKTYTSIRTFSKELGLSRNIFRICDIESIPENEREKWIESRVAVVQRNLSKGK